MVLAELKPGQSAVIESFSDDLLALKLIEVGIVPGETIVFDSVAPFGDPIAIEVSGIKIGLRKAEANTIKIRLN